jgi:phosphohistidine phosphatase
VKKKIYLIRHGESADKQHGQTDFERELTHKGKNSIELLGKFFRKEKLKTHLMISSAAIRTRETSLILSREIAYPPEMIEFETSLYNSTDQEYITYLNNFSSSLMIIGHNPAISYVIGKITNDYSISLLPGQCALIEIDDDEESKENSQSIQIIGPFHE